MFDHIARQLCLGPNEIYRFRPSVGPKKRPSKSELKQRELTVDQYEVVADWFHFAILELCALDTFKPDFDWIAQALGISVPEARVAVERLVRLGLLEITQHEEWIVRASVFAGSPQYSNAAIRKNGKQFLELAIRALEDIPVETRDQFSQVMSVNQDRIPELMARIRKFENELIEWRKSDSVRNAVYHFTVSLYPVTQLEPNEERKDLN